MNADCVDIITRTFGLIEDGEKLVSDFYHELFTRYPATEGFFAKTDMTVQHQKLLSSLNLLVQNLRYPNVLKKSLGELGARHVKYYDTLPEHYPMVGEALLVALCKHLGDEWTVEVEQAWLMAYDALVDMMINPKTPVE